MVEGFVSIILLLGFFTVPEIGGFGGADEKAEMAKSLRNGLSMIETNPHNHNWSDFEI